MTSLANAICELGEQDRRLADPTVVQDEAAIRSKHGLSDKGLVSGVARADAVFGNGVASCCNPVCDAVNGVLRCFDVDVEDDENVPELFGALEKVQFRRVGERGLDDDACPFVHELLAASLRFRLPPDRLCFGSGRVPKPCRRQQVGIDEFGRGHVPDAAFVQGALSGAVWADENIKDGWRHGVSIGSTLPVSVRRTSCPASSRPVAPGRAPRAA